MENERDDLAAAKGILYGCLLTIPVWLLAIALVIKLLKG